MSEAVQTLSPVEMADRTTGAANHGRNPGMALTPDLFEAHRVNRSAAERRAATLGTRRSVKKQWQAAWLVRALQCIDLTTLSGDDTAGKIQRLCAKARRPLREELVGRGDTASILSERRATNRSRIPSPRSFYGERVRVRGGVM